MPSAENDLPTPFDPTDADEAEFLGIPAPASAENDVTPTWTRLTQIKAVVTFTCVCGAEHEADFSGAECDGTTSVEWKCDDCDRPLLVYVDVDARVREATPIPPGEGDTPTLGEAPVGD